MKFKIVFLLLLSSTIATSQSFTRADSLFGSITEERAWWDVLHYNLDVIVDTTNLSIRGSNKITYKVLSEAKKMQIDLQAPMQIDKIIQEGKNITFTSDGNAHFIDLIHEQPLNSEQEITIYFSGKPRVAKRAPWDGGFVWSKDENNMWFIATANQGIGASVWWPNKDHAYDEPDRGATIDLSVPKGLKAVANGRLIRVSETPRSSIWSWKVINPINNYGININIGDYVNFKETYSGLNGQLDLDYWVLKDNEKKARKQFEQVPMMMEAFEHWFGPYPFYEDSFKLVEVPYLGMEHQSSVTYGNKYKNGYLGNDLSGTGWGNKFDFIIIHEAGHEWFANNISNNDVADMWLHEGFTAYSENLYLDYHFGKDASREYVIGTKRRIMNDKPIIGTYHVRNEGSSDMYYKGANILHTLRQLLEDDDKWRSILRGLNKEFYHQTVSSAQVEKYISKESKIDLTEFWDQYLRTSMIPTLEYKVDGKTLSFRYTNIIENFDMPLIMNIDGKEHWIYPKADWKTKTFKSDIDVIAVKPDFLVKPMPLD